MTRAKLSMLAALALGVSLAAGCTDDDTVVVDNVVFHPTWTIADSSGPSTCADHGAEKADFVFTPDANQAMLFDELFDCDALGGEDRKSVV